MSFETIFAFTIAMAIFSATPGPGAFAIVAQSMSRGAPAAFMLLTGILLGDMVYIIAAVFGLGVLAEQMGEVFYIVRLIGAGYLVYLGWQIWREPINAEPINASDKTGNKKSLWAGFLISLGNPKVMIFYIAFLPTFIDMTAVSNSDIMIICAITAGVTYLVEGSYILAARKMANRLQSHKARRAFNKVSGSVLVGAGAVIGIRS